MMRPEMNACTDGLLCPGKPHPRLYGSFVRILGKYVREEKLMSLEQAIYKMTAKPASVLGLTDRGTPILSLTRAPSLTPSSSRTASLM